jgi:lantibiotic leader peptide-processing serine protease
MKRRILIFTVLSVLMLSVVSLPGVAAQNGARSYIVLGTAETGISTQTMTQARNAGGQVVYNFSQIGATIVTTSDANFVSRMRAQGVTVAPNRILHNYEPLRIVKSDVRENAAGGASNRFFPIQWSIPAVRAPEAWIEGRRGQGVQVAVLDEGFYLNMPDVKWNTRLAASFVPGEPVQYTLPEGFSHGTHVSGIIASADNTFGTVGVAPKAEIVPVKVLSESLGFGEDSWVLAGMLYAAAIKVDVVNMSLGGTCEKTDPDCVAIKRVYDRVVKFMNKQGVTVIASAGNDAIDFDANRNLIDLPAMADGVIGISATGPLGWAVNDVADPKRPASYSNYGRVIVDFAAPGGDFALPGEDVCTVGAFTNFCWVFDMIISPAEVFEGDTYFYFAAGTSMAAPHVSGIAAQIISANGGSMKPNQVENALRRYARRLNPRYFYGDGFTLSN